MTKEQRLEIMRRQAESMRAMSKEEMARMQIEAADGMRQRGPATADEIEAMRNVWARDSELPSDQAPQEPMPPLFERFKRWIRA